MNDPSALSILDECDTILTSNAQDVDKFKELQEKEKKMTKGVKNTVAHLKGIVTRLGDDKLYNSISSPEGGKITTEELQNKLFLGEIDAKEFLEYLDTNEDGNISFEEFKTALFQSSDLKQDLFKKFNTYFANKKIQISLETMNKIVEFYSQKELLKNERIDEIKTETKRDVEEKLADNLLEQRHLEYLATAWTLSPEELDKEIQFATTLITLARHIKPINSAYSFNNELTYDYIKSMRDEYIENQKLTGLFGGAKKV